MPPKSFDGSAARCPDDAPALLRPAPTTEQVFREAGRLLGAQRFADAAEMYLRVLSLSPGRIDALFGLGNALHRGGQHESAVSVFGQIVRMDPGLSAVHANMGNALRRCGDPEAAEQSYLRALGIAPGLAEVQVNLGNLYRDLGRLEEALFRYQTAIEADQSNPDVFSNLGNVLRELGQMGPALDAYEHAIRLQPDHAAANENRAFALLASGDFPRGFAEYEWRWRGTQTPRPHPYPRWQGESLAAETLLIWGEQGVGDEIMFSSLVERVAGRARSAIVECDARLVPLMSRSMPDIEFVGRTDPPDASIPGCMPTMQVPMGSLPRWQTPGDAPLPSFLRADPEHRRKLRSAYKSKVPGLLVGLSWKSGNALFGRARSSGLTDWIPLLKLGGASFVNLQYGDTARERLALRQAHGIDVLHDSDIDPLHDMDAFAAQVSAVDLVISVDNSAVHVAGALGKPVWNLLDTAPSWRWGCAGERSYWYPTMRLWRQSERGRWSSLMQRMAAELQTILAQGAPV